MRREVAGNLDLVTLTDDQRRMLKRRIETIKTLEEDIEKLREDRIERAMEVLNIDTLGSVNALVAFGSASDWEPIAADRKSVV